MFSSDIITDLYPQVHLSAKTFQWMALLESFIDAIRNFGPQFPTKPTSLTLSHVGRLTTQICQFLRIASRLGSTNLTRYQFTTRSLSVAHGIWTFPRILKTK